MDAPWKQELFSKINNTPETEFIKTSMKRTNVEIDQDIKEKLSKLDEIQQELSVLRNERGYMVGSEGVQFENLTVAETISHLMSGNLSEKWSVIAKIVFPGIGKFKSANDLGVFMKKLFNAKMHIDAKGIEFSVRTKKLFKSYHNKPIFGLDHLRSILDVSLTMEPEPLFGDPMSSENISISLFWNYDGDRRNRVDLESEYYHKSNRRDYKAKNITSARGIGFSVGISTDTPISEFITPEVLEEYGNEVVLYYSLTVKTFVNLKLLNDRDYNYINAFK